MAFFHKENARFSARRWLRGSEGGDRSSGTIRITRLSLNQLSRIHRKGYRNRPLRDWEKAGNQNRSRFRARVEHVFGAQRGDWAGPWFAASGFYGRGRA